MSLINDIRTSIRNLDRSDKAMTKFGLTMAIALIILGTVVFIYNSFTVTFFITVGLGLLFLMSGFLFKPLLRPIYVIWMGIALVLGWFISRIILAVLFYFVFMPIGIIMKIINKDVLNRKLEPGKTSYWIKRPEKAFDINRYQRQF
ncbi:MAG: hypothetical protein JXR46_07795 [Calditrichaceae bacterium]|nr:hypothetical protein [Calditrichaceae bacterium]MBN2708930.1 hypothetical protein [Calditrichaceae bacterium]RQV97547.1 MAG: hypothetical protein EH224_00565 [Calditrichota bacterium]